MVEHLAASAHCRVAVSCSSMWRRGAGLRLPVRRRRDGCGWRWRTTSGTGRRWRRWPSSAVTGSRSTAGCAWIGTRRSPRPQALAAARPVSGDLGGRAVAGPGPAELSAGGVSRDPVRAAAVAIACCAAASGARRHTRARRAARRGAGASGAWAGCIWSAASGRIWCGRCAGRCAPAWCASRSQPSAERRGASTD